MQKDESPLPPPIPPRRKRCKTQPKRPTITYTLETKPERKHRPAPPLPPPTAPQRNRGRRKTPSPFNENSSPTNAKSLHSLEYGPNSLEESTRHSFVNLETEKSNRSRSTSPFPKAPEINKYPPLYFTFQDYQMVMEGSVRSKDELFKEKNITFIEENQNVFIEEQKSNFTLGQKEKFDEENDKYSKDQQQEYNEEQEDKFFKEQQSAFVEEEKHNGVEEEENDDESIEQTLKMNTESNAFPVRENLTSATENEELYFHISSANEPHMSKEEFESPFAPFMENISFSNAREEIYFRVTTTDRPFEKCLGDWNRSFDNEPKEFKDESESNLYMFEDYMDRSNRLNARPRLLFSEDFFSIPQDENSVSTERSTTRVRFLIESPSTSTPDYDLNDDGTTYEEFIQRQFESYEKSSVQLTEVTDEELEDLDKNLNNTYENETENNEVSNFESETAEDENMSESIYGLTADQINDYSYSDWEEEIENVETHSITACIENESNTDIKTEENVELSQLQEIIDNNIEIKNEDCTIEESCEVELIINKSEEACDIEVKNEDIVIEKLHKKELIIDENEGACYVEIKNENIIVEELQEKESIIDKSEKTYERRKVFLDSSFYNLSNENDMWQSCDDNRDDTLPDECCQPNLPEVSEPTKYFEESIGIEEQNEINVERDSKHIENLKEEIICTTIPEIESTVEKKPVPESVRRNSFLETMLRDNFSQDSWDTGSINCEVIATHPKQDLSALSEQQSTRPLDVDTEVATETEAAPRNNSKIKLTESGSQPKVQSRINVSSSNNKSAGDVKCDVLNELLTTFSAIKLKPVNTSTCESVRSKDPNEQKTDITMPVEVKTDKSYQFRKTQNTLEIKNDENLKKEENFNSSIINSNLNVLTTDENLNLPKVDPNLNSLKVEESSIASINKDTSAIINEASNTQRNDNDNKAQTPVVVNKDQFREAVSIIPGSVRNFVKYYEIHSEISSISKIRDNAFKKQKCELVRDKEKSKAYKKSGEKNKKIFKNSTSPKTGITTNANIIDESSRKIPSPLNSPNEIKKKSSMKTIAPSPRPERKKSVQFDSDCTVINPRKKEDKEKEEEGTFSSFIGGIRTRLKKKAPIKPDVKKTEQPKGLKLDQCRTESTAIICIQKSPEAKAMACTTKPGNIGFLPKTETLQNNQTIVFYCTV